MKSLATCLTVVIVVGIGTLPKTAVAASDVDKAAMQKVTADCKAQVKQYAQYNDTSWYQRHKMMKGCVSDALAKK
jgi:hypothetical protein